MKPIRILLLLALLSGPCLTARAQKVEPLMLEDSASWSMVLLPDPQSYVKYGYNQPLLEVMTRWIRYNVERLNIRLVLCTGDMVEENFRTVSGGDGWPGDQPSTEQWESVSRSFGMLDDTIPYILCTGNHDYGYKSSENRYSQLNSYFPPNRDSRYAELLTGMFENAAGVKTIENAWYEFKAPTGENYLIVSLEFQPRRAIVEAARELVARPEYRDHRVIWLTHGYMNSEVLGNSLISQNDYPTLTDVTLGDALWRELIEPSANSSMVLCGHVVDDMSHRGHVGFRTDKNRAGRNVHQMVFNAQAEEEAGKETEATAGCACSSFIPTGGRSPYTRSLRCWASFPRRSAYRSARNPTTISPSRWIKSRYRNRDSFLRRGQRMPSVSAAGRVSGIPYSRMRAGFFFERIQLAFLQP